MICIYYNLSKNKIINSSLFVDLMYSWGELISNISIASTHIQNHHQHICIQHIEGDI